MYKVESAQVLVFGDSWGVFGYPYLQDMLDSHNTGLTVKNYAIGGTTSTFWARDPNVINHDIDENSDAEYMWLSIGGNDIIHYMPNCTLHEDIDDCVTQLVKIVTDNTISFLTPVFKNHPNIKLFQFGYDIMNLAMNPFCRTIGTEIDYKCIDKPSCLNPQFIKMQSLYVDNMPSNFEGYDYTALDLLGSLQAYGNVTDASLGNPNLDYWSPKDLMMENCIHPNENGFPVIMDNLWDLYFSKQLN